MCVSSINKNRNILVLLDCYSFQSVVHWQNIDISTILPNLGSLLSVPPPGYNILSWLDIARNHHLITDHTKGPVPTAPTFMAIVIRWVKFSWHMGRVPTVPTLINFWTRSWKVWAILPVRTPEVWSTFLLAHLTRWPMITPAPTNECHSYVIVMDSRNGITRPSWALWNHWTYRFIHKHPLDWVECTIVPHLKEKKRYLLIHVYFTGWSTGALAFKFNK